MRPKIEINLKSSDQEFNRCKFLSSVQSPLSLPSFSSLPLLSSLPLFLSLHSNSIVVDLSTRQIWLFEQASTLCHSMNNKSKAAAVSIHKNFLPTKQRAHIYIPLSLPRYKFVQCLFQQWIHINPPNYYWIIFRLRILYAVDPGWEGS